MTFEEFVDQWNHTQYPTNWRKGQSLFNTLHGVRPDLANKIRSTRLDPFYNDSWLRMHDCLEWLKTHWNDQ